MQKSLIQDILKELTRRGEKLSVAESCTGGLLCSAFTDIAGASNAIEGGIVAYQDDVKIQLLNIDHKLLEVHSAVSESVASQMALNVAKIFNTQWSLATTGFLKPTATLEDEKSGLVFISGLTPKGSWTLRAMIHEERVEAKLKVVEIAIQGLYDKIFT